MTRRRLLLPAAALAAALAAPTPTAAQVPPFLEGRPVVAVELDGPEDLLDESPTVPVAPGTPLDAALVRRIVEGWAATGRWADVQVDAVAIPGGPTRPPGVRLVVHLSPQLVLVRLDFVGNVHLDADTLGRTMDLGAGDPLPIGYLDERAARAEDAYREIGFEDARVDAFVRDTDDPARKVVIVRVVEGPATRVTALRLEPRVPGVDAAALLGLERGARLDRRAVAEAARRAGAALRARGHLEAEVRAPRVERTGAHRVSLVFPALVGPAYRVRVVGRGAVELGAVREAMAVGEERLASAASLEAMAERIVDAYVRRGFPDARAEVTRRRDRDGAGLELVAEITPGPQVDVVAITFPGARAFDDDFLRREVVSYLEEDVPASTLVEPVDTEVVDALGFGGDPRFRREVNAPLVVSAERVFYRPTYEEAVAHLAEVYRAAGYLDARVGPARLQRLADRSRGVVLVPVVEGARTLVGRLEVSGNTVSAAGALLRAAALRPGEPFSYLAVEEARVRLSDWYRERGYLFARVEPVARFSADGTRADVRFEIVERYPVTVGDVVIEGAEMTQEGMVRELVRLAPGDVYLPRLVRESQDRLLALGTFSTITIAPATPDLPERVKDVIVTLTERPSQFLELRAGLSTGEGARGGLEYGYRNLFGFAVGLRLRLQLAYQFLIVDPQFRERLEPLDLIDRLERRVSAGVELPYLPSLRDLRLAVDLVHVRDNQRDFGLDQNAVVLTANWRPERRWTLTATTQLENNDVSLFVDQTLADFRSTVNDPRIRQLLRVPEGASTLLAIGAVASVDHRDNAFDPTEGFFFSVAGEWDRTLAAETIEVTPRSSQDPRSVEFFSNFLKLSVTANGYLKLTDRVVLAMQGRFGRIVHLEAASETYPNRAFFLGGVNTMRGFLQDNLIPQDRADLLESERLARICQKAAATADPLDDEICVSPNSLARSGDVFALLRVELRFPLFAGVRGGVFADVGNLWADATRLDLLQLRPTAGIGLRIDTPVGPLAFDYGFNLLRRERLDEDFGAFQFSIGLF